MPYINYKRILFIFLLLLYAPAAFAQTDSLLRELSYAIEHKETYLSTKKEQIALLKNLLLKDYLSLAQQFKVYEELHHEYRTFQYDSAFTYALKLRETANQLNDSAKVTIAKLRLSHTLLASGMYKEALDSLNRVNAHFLPQDIKADFYALKSRTYYDISGYTQDIYYSSRYARLGESYVDSALALLDKNELQFYALRGMKHEIAMEAEEARVDFEMILDKFNPSLNQYAMAANSLGNIYYNRGDTNKGIAMMAKAAIADIKASVKEGVALMTLAEFLYHHGDESRAYDYIKQALEDADFYGAKQRKIQVAAILPIIEGERLATVEHQRSRLLVYFIAVSLLSVLVVIFIIIIFKQLKQLRLTKKNLTAANANLKTTNKKLKETNEIQQRTNSKLIEANIIKEEYIGYSFNMYTDYLNKIEKLKRAVERKLLNRKFDDISHVLDSVNMKQEREILFLSFDKAFLKLFPNFVQEFNSFFKEEDRFILKDNQLNIELRIFALIRLGIYDHEQIASILEYSVRTIYNYKTKVKNKSILSNEEFEQKVMEIAF